MFAYKRRPGKTTLRVNNVTKGEHMHVKLERIKSNNEPVDEGVPMIFTERSQGVLPNTDITTDRFDLAVQATDAMSKQQIAKNKGTTPITKGEGKTDSEESPKE